MQLIKHPRFLKEYKTWQEKVNTITDDTVKAELNSLLNSLVTTVKKIDTFHNDFAITNPNSSLTDAREQLMSIRRKIHHKIQECQGAGLIKN